MTHPALGPVDRGRLFVGASLAVHDNVCKRTDPRVSDETRPLEFDEIVFARAGVWVRHRQHEELVVDATVAHLFAHGEVHRVSHPERCGDRNTGLVLSRDTLAAIAPRAVERGSFDIPALPIDTRMYAEHCALVDGLRNRTWDALEAEERALHLAAAVITAAERRRTRPAPRHDERARRHRALTRAALELLAVRFREPLELADLAALLDVSVFHLCRVFRATTGMSLHEQRRSLRVRAALRLLPDGDLTLYDITAATGFTDRTQLTRAFQRELGEAPTAWRRRVALDREQESPRAPDARS